MIARTLAYIQPDITPARRQGKLIFTGLYRLYGVCMYTHVNNADWYRCRAITSGEDYADPIRCLYDNTLVILERIQC